MITFQDMIEEIFTMLVTFHGQKILAYCIANLDSQTCSLRGHFCKEKMTAIYVFKKFNFWKGRFIFKVVRTFHFFSYLLCIYSRYVLPTKIVYFGDINFIYNNMVSVKIIWICLSQKPYRTYPTSMTMS